MSSTTIQTVNGLAVIADEPTETPLKTKDGKPVLFRRIRTLMLEDSSVVYGCALCDYTAENWTSVRPHLMKHADKKPATQSVPKVQADVLEMTLGELLEEHKRAELLGATVAKQTDEIATLRARAKKAEADLAAVRNALSRLGIAGISPAKDSDHA